MITSLFFYLFAAMTVASGFMVITARNPVHAVLFLIFSFFNAAGLFILMGAEFLAMLLVVVYVGAVAVLFLFVVMMLDINFDDMREGFRRHLPLGTIIGFILMIELVLIFAVPETSIGVVDSGSSRSNTAQIGDVLYTDYIFLFQLAGLILLVAMIGAITLTMRHREGVKRQSIALQNSRSREETVEIVSVKSHVAPQEIAAKVNADQKVLR
ncbi:MAG: NADH-quinone oxidoreductase subunit J [Alphaproteobacteria bacterium]|jgi:NADH-quinone oxidoreductase subunit J|nr:NADH-quinone oxidoreductase subunit J [Alphaproteobacteria bacterium]